MPASLFLHPPSQLSMAILRAKLQVLLICDQGCSSPLNYTECTTKCLNCRRESSSCDWVQLTPPSESDEEFCEQCYGSCWCKIGARCYDNYTSPTTTGGHNPATTAKLTPRGLKKI